jgi:type IV secretion system protein VirB6/type IV secretion system protein TrbL
LAKGAETVAKDKASEISASFQENISQTVSGKIAEAIKGSGIGAELEMPTFDHNNLSGAETQSDPATDEIAVFVNRQQP